MSTHWEAGLVHWLGVGDSVARADVGPVPRRLRTEAETGRNIKQTDKVI